MKLRVIRIPANEAKVVVGRVGVKRLGVFGTEDQFRAFVAGRPLPGPDARFTFEIEAGELRACRGGTHLASASVALVWLLAPELESEKPEGWAGSADEAAAELWRRLGEKLPGIRD